MPVFKVNAGYSPLLNAIEFPAGMPEFYEAFDIRPEDGMDVAPEDRISIW